MLTRDLQMVGAIYGPWAALDNNPLENQDILIIRLGNEHYPLLFYLIIRLPWYDCIRNVLQALWCKV